jgi:hypothetical protein
LVERTARFSPLPTPGIASACRGEGRLRSRAAKGASKIGGLMRMALAASQWVGNRSGSGAGLGHGAVRGLGRVSF